MNSIAISKSQEQPSKAVVYARVSSTVDKNDNYSLVKQIDICTKYTQKQNIKLAQVIKEER